MALPTNPATKAEFGLRYNSSGVPLCTICPLDITATRSAIAIASSWSCVTNIAVILNSRKRTANSSRNISRNAASSADNGSSNKSILGRGAIALAKATRWRCPPERASMDRLENFCN